VSMNLKSCSTCPGLYVHIPFCRTKCRYCGFFSEPIEKYDAAAVISAMIVELERYNPFEEIKTIYIGGGSPSCLPKEQLLQLISRLTALCPAAREFTIEINPGQVNQNLLSELKKSGVNRLSIGSQSFIQQELDFLGRSHTVSSINESVKQGRQAGFENISLDLIFAIPGSCIDSWKHNLQSAIQLNVEHISAYSLTFEDDTPLSQDLAAGIVEPVDEDTDRAMYELTIDMLQNAGLLQYEISNFAKKGFECRHNLGYWANNGYIGIGPAAASYLNGIRTTNYNDINKYAEAIQRGESSVQESEKLNDNEMACETAVLNLRRRCGIDLDEFKTRTGFDAMKLFAEPIRKYKKLGLINIADRKIFLTREALPIADSILCDFAAV